MIVTHSITMSGVWIVRGVIILLVAGLVILMVKALKSDIPKR